MFLARKSACLLTALFLMNTVFSQTEKERNWTLNGYIKEMASYSVLQESYLFDNLVHNRLNFRWYINDDLRFAAEMRNRLFTGDRVRINPYFSELNFPERNDFRDLSETWEDSSKVVLNIMLDRLYLHYTLGKFEVKAGRQRINWGINMAWNPNDIFNAFSYFDFDYEERPGSDALLLKYNTGIASSIEIAGNMADEFEEFTSAALWKINYKKYDFQFLGGVSNENLVLGSGWAGNIKQAGFKGEGTYFHPLEDALDSAEVFAGTLSLEYSFKNSLFLNGSVLYSSNGKKNPSATDQLLYYSGNISAKYLSPYTWSALVQAGYRFHPLVNGGIAVIGYPGSSDAFVNPYFTVSILQSLDFDAIAQLLLNRVNEKYIISNQLYYFRLKFSF